MEETVTQMKCTNYDGILRFFENEQRVEREMERHSEEPEKQMRDQNKEELQNCSDFVCTFQNDRSMTYSQLIWEAIMSLQM